MEDRWEMGAVKAVGNVVALSLEREQFVWMLGNDLRGLIKRSLDKKALVSFVVGNGARARRHGEKRCRGRGAAFVRGMCRRAIQTRAQSLLYSHLVSNF